MKKLALLLALLLSGAAQAQQNFNMPPPAGVMVGGFQVVSSCGSGSLATTTPAFGTMDTTGKFCVAATVSASVTGFAPGGAFATLTASATSGSVALPTGAVVLFQNVGTTAVSCTLGIGSATAVASETIVQPASTVALTVGSNTFGACIDQTGSASNLVVLSGGAGIATGWGGGSGSSGGSVTQGTSPWVDNITQVASTALGTPVGYGSTPTGNALSANVFVTNTNTNLATNADGIAGVAAGAAGAGSPVNSANYAWNGSTWDRTKAQGDPCAYQPKLPFTIATSSGTVQLVAPSGSTQVYICSLITIGATASIQNLVGGTGASCTTGTPVAMAGSTTAANGMSFAANGGFTFGNGGGTVLRTTTAGHGVCLIQSATAAIAGGGTYVQQ